MGKQEELNLLLQLKDGVTKVINQINNSVKSNFESMKASALIFGGAFAAITATVYKAIEAYSEQENSTKALNRALANSGKLTKETSRELLNYASELAKVTKYADETTAAEIGRASCRERV